MLLTRCAFERMVAQALDELPDEILAALDNLEVVVEDEPTAAQRAEVGLRTGTLFGLYQGIPRTERTSAYGMVMPDTITIFQGPIARHARTAVDVRRMVRETVIHEVAHHFGISDDRLRQLGRY